MSDKTTIPGQVVRVGELGPDLYTVHVRPTEPGAARQLDGSHQAGADAYAVTWHGTPPAIGDEFAGELDISGGPFTVGAEGDAEEPKPGPADDPTQA